MAPSKYLAAIEQKASISATELDKLLGSHALAADAMRADDFDAHFRIRMAEILVMIEKATGKQVQNDFDDDQPEEAPEQFDLEDEAVIPDADDLEE